MITNRDILKLTETFVTKNEFNTFKDEMITRFDKVLHELRSMREEVSVMFYRQREHSDMLEDHEQRLAKVEKLTTSDLA